MTGGYRMIDLYGLDLANIQLDSNKIDKIFNDIESTYKTKALLFDNYKIMGGDIVITVGQDTFNVSDVKMTRIDTYEIKKNKPTRKQCQYDNQ